MKPLVCRRCLFGHTEPLLKQRDAGILLHGCNASQAPGPITPGLGILGAALLGTDLAYSMSNPGMEGTQMAGITRFYGAAGGSTSASLPFGTALGVYCLWGLLNRDAESLFRRRSGWD